jgi:hypothetical protein
LFNPIIVVKKNYTKSSGNELSIHIPSTGIYPVKKEKEHKVLVMKEAKLD